MFPRSVKVIAKNIDKVENIGHFCLPMLDTDQQYNTLVEMIRLKYDDSLAENENIVTKYLNEDNELVTFNSDKDLEYAVQCQMLISNERDPTSIRFVFKVYTGRTDQNANENNQGYLINLSLSVNTKKNFSFDLLNLSATNIEKRGRIKLT
jgi:hypothetical protein